MAQDVALEVTPSVSRGTKRQKDGGRSRPPSLYNRSTEPDSSGAPRDRVASGLTAVPAASSAPLVVCVARARETKTCLVYI